MVLYNVGRGPLHNKDCVRAPHEARFCAMLLGVIHVALAAAAADAEAAAAVACGGKNTSSSPHRLLGNALL